MILINALGMPCPIPVVKTTKAIAALPQEGGAVEILVDNEVACENLKKMADGEGYGYEMKIQDENVYSVVLSIGQKENAVEKSDAPPLVNPAAGADAATVVAIGKNFMGDGDEALGKILIKGFIYALTELDPLPKAVLFFNSGVKLAVKTANTLDDLKALQDKGVKIWLCGTCVDYYHLKDEVAVGEITNMYGIVTAMHQASNIINI